MVTIRIASVSVNKKIEIEEENLNFGVLEDKVYDLGLAMARGIMEHLLVLLDNRLRSRRLRKAFENCGKGKKYLSTRMGDIRYSRTRYSDRGAGGYRYLLDEALGLEKRQTVSIGRRRLEAMEGVMAKSYRVACTHMEKLTGTSRSHEAIRGVVLEEGERLQKAEESELQRVYDLEDSYAGESHDVAYIEVDGTSLHHQGTDRKKARGLEVKIGICYTGKRRRYRGGSGAAKVLENKYVHLDIKPGPAFMEDMSLVADHEVGLSEAKHVVVGGDGAPWIRRGIEMNFPGSIYKLCEYHLNQQLTRSFSGLSVDKGRVRKLLRKNKVDRALAAIWDTLERCTDEAQLKRVADFYGYVRDNRAGIRDLSEVIDDEVGIQIERTGAIENTVDKAVAHRCKHRGYRWSYAGARSLLKVQQALVNGRFDQWWYEDRDKPTVAVSRESLAPLSAAEVHKEDGTEGTVEEISLPCFHGPDQGKPWVKALKGMLEIKEL